MNFSLFDDEILKWIEDDLLKKHKWLYGEGEIDDDKPVVITLKKGDVTSFTPEKTKTEEIDGFDNLIGKMFKHRQ